MPALTRDAVAELDHADSLDLLHRQTTVLELIAGGAALPEMLTAVTVALEELIPGSRCSVLVLDDSGTTLRHGAAPSLPPVYSAAVDGIALGPESGSCGTAAHLDAEVVAEDILDDARWTRFHALASPHGLRACWSSPIHGRAIGGATGVLGTFAVYHDVPHRPSERERRLVERFTHLSSVAIEHARLYGALTESEERFRRAFEDNAVGMALTGLDGRFGRVNRALREMLGHDEDALLAAGLGSVLDPPTAPAALTAIELCTSGALDSVQFETTLLRADGEPVQAGVTASVVRGAGGEPVYLSVNVLDVTARRAAEADRRARRDAELAREVAESASRAKSDFLSALSHELRTPLQAITGFTELLGTLELSPARRSAALGHIGGASSHILALVDDVLDIAAIEAGALPLHPVDVDVAGLVGEVVDLLGPLADERGVVLDACAPCGTVRADPRRLRQVLINLVTNGVRYNHAGGRVRVRAGAGTIRVADSGPGIPEEFLERLFVPFDRLGADVGPEPGAGLGMVLARGLTEAMGGQLTVDSAPGSGTTVLVRLPVS
ncbi:GAF domain-containing sensor histidine kinase [Pseudonocardia abyssalis]|uniref:histidine kinase n=1 Tax=Pseudonocardia abyssalis TaxID=2792008 RepID=A0ABS6V224_9PSEU|nr:GAF domain-containing sensor histidine kinase [Pseudonocardia abyssalis]MBW0114163.1 PAS domain S-box protein [Pseudonocardia abyssalis]MBW0138556.1 PAS domain S-box protein [Pseudonocardia abyssalis]